MTKNIAIVHYRVGKTDGVSLEIKKRKKVLEDMGYSVKLISGPVQVDADYVIDELEFDVPQIVKLKNNAFKALIDYSDERELGETIEAVSQIIEEKLTSIHKKEKFSYLFLHNIFTHGRHIAAAKALYDFISKNKVNTISVNHDFYWVGSYKDIYKPTCNFIINYLKSYVPPPPSKYIKHVTINSINEKALYERIKEHSTIIPDTFDFQQPPWVADEYNKDLLARANIKPNDLIVLQATRIASRKGIELAIDFVKELDSRKNEFIGKTLYNGKVITGDSDIVLIMAGYAEKDSEEYKMKLLHKIEEENIKAVFISDFINAERSTHKGRKVYSLWDAYVYADLITFPSLWEGWGNQLIEAVFARKPVVVFEYPVFISDIKKEGYAFISLGSDLMESKSGLVSVPKKVLMKSVDNSIEFLLNDLSTFILHKNFDIGKKFHDNGILAPLLNKLLT